MDRAAMKLSHRRWHRRAWVFLLPIATVILIAALAVRPVAPGRVVPWTADGSR
jgi:hypothetical protein